MPIPTLLLRKHLRLRSFFEAAADCRRSRAVKGLERAIVVKEAETKRIKYSRRPDIIRAATLDQFVSGLQPNPPLEAHGRTMEVFSGGSGTPRATS